MPIADIRSLGRSASSVPLKTATTALRRAVVRAYPSRRRRFALRMSLTFCLLLLRLLDADTYGVGIVGPGRLRRRLYLLLLLSLRQGPRKTAGAGIVALLGQLLQRRVLSPAVRPRLSPSQPHVPAATKQRAENQCRCDYDCPDHDDLLFSGTH